MIFINNNFKIAFILIRSHSYYKLLTFRTVFMAMAHKKIFINYEETAAIKGSSNKILDIKLMLID